MYKIQTLNEIAPVIFNYFPDARYQVSKSIADPDAYLIRSYQMHGMQLGEQCLAIARAGAGTNNIPIDACTKAGIVVFNTPGANANAVSEMVIAGLLLSARRIVPAINWAQAQKGQGSAIPALVEKGKNQFVGPELRGKTLGVQGLGAVGILVANAAHGMGMNVLGYDPYISVNAAWSLSRGINKAASQEALMAQSDYITLHVPLLEDTRALYGPAAFAKMKQGAVLLNFSRGELVDNDAVLAALDSGKLSRYVTDFPCEELIGREDVICIPHLGASTPEAEDNCADMAAHQLAQYLETGMIVNSVNFPNCELPFTGPYRLAVIHQNITNMVGQITAILAAEDINIAHMMNKSRKEIAYTVLDLEAKVSDTAMKSLLAVEGIQRIRLLENRG